MTLRIKRKNAKVLMLSGNKTKHGGGTERANT
jgi:hypothetical protein